MGTLAFDFRYAFRLLGKNRWFTAVAVITLALGIGATSAIFTVADAVLLKPLPYTDPGRIVRLGRQFPGNFGDTNSVPKFMTWRANSHSFSAMALYGLFGQAMNLGAGDPPRQVRGLQVSSGYFQVFGVTPLLGRGFTEAEDSPGGARTVVLSYGLWQSGFGGDRGVLGREVVLDGQPYVAVGVLPKGFQSDPESDLWLALQADPNSDNHGHYLAAAARLKPGVGVEAARSDLQIAGERFRRENPKWMNSDERAGLLPMQEAMVREVKTSLAVLMCAVAFVLLIACANVANLLLARAASRQREMAVRAAVGASRWRVLRQLLTESVVLASLGGILGFGLGQWLVGVLLKLAPGNIPRLMSADGSEAVVPPVDWRIVLFTAGVALATGMVFGLFPALHASSPNLAASIKEGGGRSGTGLRHNRARSVLVVSEVALAMVLLVGAALLIRTFIGLSAVKPGIDPHNVLTMQTPMGGGNYNTTAKVDSFVVNVCRRLETQPGVEAAASSVTLPVSMGVDLPFNIVGKPPGKGSLYNGDEQWRSISDRYFQVFRIPLLRGRVFRQTDSAGSARVVVINESMARRYWPNEDPMGRSIVIAKGLGPKDFEDPPREIVGIVGNVRETGLGAADIGVMYVPQSQVPEGVTGLLNGMVPLSWAVRTAANPLQLRTLVERQFRSVDPAMTPARERTMEQVIEKSVARQNFNMLLLGIFAGVALLLAAIGIYGLMAYGVEQRRQEIGIRMALGASGTQVLGMVMAQGMKLAGAGLAVGLGLAWAMTRFLGSLLFGVHATDPVTFGGVTLLLTVVALGATLIPARRAARTMPDQALRYQ